jgi:hypothetical protein
MSGLFGSPDTPEPPPVPKMPDYEAVNKAKRRKSAQKRYEGKGRASTVLTDKETLG